jgi:putative tricarboxylic transport membrane protein
MVKADRISGIFWLVFAVLVSIESRRLGLGTLHRPGPGFLFFWAGIFLAIMSLIVLMRAWSQNAESSERIFGGRNVLKAALVIASLFAYGLLMEWIGFVPITLVLFVFLLGMIEKKGWVFTALVSIAVTVAAYLIFETALQSQLPKGLLSSWRF